MNFLCYLRRNLIGSQYISKDIKVNFETSFFGRKKPRSFIVEHKFNKFINKEPFYNHETNSYSLNFNGRVTIPSVKNFQLVHPSDKTYLVLTFGKIGSDKYVMDYKFPFSAVVAFQVCLCAIDGKYFCD
ncbi:tubby protein [Vairimorpha apis BRL 01]|uniref:Tubby protein n=1 Tax=Vairimorpha apis BRL 01 TaxID=1037528 RepID=T0MFF3_9MICR|nr:tubby protein [Vairimorpha apis BRL 01]